VCTLRQINKTDIAENSAQQAHLYITRPTPESIYRIKTFANEYVLVHIIKMVYNIEVRLNTKVVNVIVLTPSEQY